MSRFLGVEVLTPQLSKLVFLSQRVELTEKLSISELLSFRHQGLHSQSTTLGGAIHTEFYV